jgi:putative SOS response-associated peptidase YedK
VPENRTFKPPPKIDSNALNESRPLFFFAGIWTAWNGVRKVKTGLVPLNCSAS